MNINTSYIAEEARNAAFDGVFNELPARRLEVLKAFFNIGKPASAEEISAFTGLKVQSITGRILELRGYLWDSEKKESVFNADKEFLIFDSYVRYKDTAKKQPDKKSGIRWKLSSKAINEIQGELF